MHARAAVLAFALVVSLSLAPLRLCAQNTPTNGNYATGKMVSVRQVARNGVLVSRYSSTHVFTVDFTVQLSGHSYCVEYDTVVLDEVNDLVGSNQKDVQGAVQGSRIQVILPDGRRIHAQLANATQC